MTARRTEPAVGLSTAERLVLGYLRGVLRARAGARLNLHRVAACVCLPADVVAASVEALAARRLLHTRADGRVVLHQGGDAP
ncbi:hypothetical protein ACI792_04435 [Blastococcus sp. SYSU DS0669]